MTTDLRDRLDDLLAGVPDHVIPEPRTAWAAGHRRRTRRRLVVAAAAVALLVLVAGVALFDLRPADLEPAGSRSTSTWTGGPREATQFPARIDDPGTVTAYVTEPWKPIAGLVQTSDGWATVSQHGDLVALNTASDVLTPVVSPDGNLIPSVGLSGVDQLSIFDLEAQSDQVYNVGRARGGYRWQIPPGSRPFWAQDSYTLLVPVVPTLSRDEGVVAVMVNPSTARANPVRPPDGSPRAVPVGFVPRVGALQPLAEGALAWLDTDGATPTLVTTEGQGGFVLDRIPLEGLDSRDLLEVSLSLNGNILARTQGEYWLYGPGGVALDQGAVPDQTFCPVTWSSEGALFPVVHGQGGAALVTPDGETVVQAEPSLGVECSSWSAAALDGTAYRNLGARLFGTSDTWLAWHAREAVQLLLLLGLVGALSVAARWAIRRSR